MTTDKSCRGELNGVAVNIPFLFNNSFPLTTFEFSPFLGVSGACELLKGQQTVFAGIPVLLFCLL